MNLHKTFQNIYWNVNCYNTCIIISCKIVYVIYIIVKSSLQIFDCITVCKEHVVSKIKSSLQKANIYFMWKFCVIFVSLKRGDRVKAIRNNDRSKLRVKRWQEKKES